MIFGNVILGYDQMCAPSSTSHIDNITSNTISNAYYDDFYITKNTDYALGRNVPTGWDDDTILDGKFDDDTGLTAGNINTPLKGLSGKYILVKRRIKDEYKWITLQAFPTTPPNDTSNTRNASTENEDNPLIQTFKDYTAIPGIEYEYAIVFATKDGEDIQESDYYIVSITPDTDKMSIFTADEMWGTIVTDGFCNNQRNTAPGVINTLNDKYPTIVDHSVSNYETVDVTGEFYPVDSETGCPILDDDPANIREINKQLKKFKDFLMNRKAKILKNVDGRMWFCYVTTPPSDNAKDVYYFREISFGVTEVAEIDDEEELYNSGFISASQEWWNA